MGIEEEWESLNLSTLQKKLKWINNYVYILKQRDYQQAYSSSSLLIYPRFKFDNYLHKHLNIGLKLNDLKIIAQIRLLNKFNPRIIIKKSKFNFKTKKYCKYCNEIVDEEFYVFQVMEECKMFAHREKSMYVRMRI